MKPSLKKKMLKASRATKFIEKSQSEVIKPQEIFR
jgi:hypothetical protein